MAAGSVGIDIGAGYTKVVELGPRGTLLRAEAFPTPYQLDTGGSHVVDVKGLGERLRRSAASPNLSGARAATAIASSCITSCVVTVPTMPEKELRSAAVFEARRTMIPTPGPDALFESQVLGQKGADPSKVEVLIVKAERQGRDERFDVLKNAGIRPYVITSPAFALLHALPDDERQKPLFAIVSLGAQSVDVIIVRQGRHRFFRSVSFGSQEIIANLASTLGVSGQEADRLLMASGVPDQRPAGPAEDAPRKEQLAVLQQALQPSFDRLVTEIRRSLIFYQEETGERLETIVLSGGGTLIPNVRSELEQKIGGTLRVLDPLQELDLAKGLSADVTAPTALYALAYGLARIACEPKRAREAINFIPLEVRRQRARSVRLILSASLMGAVCLGLTGGWVAAAHREASLRAAIQKSRKAYQGLERFLDQREAITERERALTTRLALLEQLQALPPELPALLHQVARVVPEAITLTELSVTRSAMLEPAAADPASLQSPHSGMPPPVAGQLSEEAEEASDASGLMQGPGGQQPWKLLLKAQMTTPYEEASALAERLKERLKGLPQVQAVSLRIVGPKELRPRSVGGEVELTQIQTFTLNLVATLQ